MSADPGATGEASSLRAATAADTPQAGILNRPTEHLLLVSLDLTGDARATLALLTDLVQAELTSKLAAGPGDPALPAAETGELGYGAHHDRAHLTITVGFSASAYDKLGVAAADRPADLIPVPWSQLGDTPEPPASGDVILQICADNAYVAEHVLRRIEHSLQGQVQVLWAHTGVQRYTSRAGRPATHEARNWSGFLDGTSNLDPAHNPADRALTFVDPDGVGGYPKLPASGQPGSYGPNNVPSFPGDLRPPPVSEPSWTRGGSYLAARVTTFDLSRWDEAPLSAQESAVGRTKETGVSLDRAGENGATPDALPAFASDPSDVRVAVTAHVRKANPRTPDDLNRRIFRRGYPLYEGGTPGLRRGLIFLAYGRSLSTQFEFIFRAWLKNADFPRPGAGVDQLLAFDGPVLAGGYYFVPPLDQPHKPWTWHIPPASTT